VLSTFDCCLTGQMFPSSAVRIFEISKQME